MISDEEYLCSCIAVAHELSRYCLGRASASDSSSVSICRQLVSELNGQMMTFDLRNGSLRRKYDSLKWAMRRIEDITYEMAMLQWAQEDKSGDAASGGEPQLKKTKREEEAGSSSPSSSPSSPTSSTSAVGTDGSEPSSLLTASDFDAARVRMEVYDKAREEVIKACRDVQKEGKTAISSLQRAAAAGGIGGVSGHQQDKNLMTAMDKMTRAETLAVAIVNGYLKDHPTLRQGAYSNAMEVS